MNYLSRFTNIGKKEQKKRKTLAITALIIGLILLMGFYYNHLNHDFGFILFPFFFLAAIGFLQAHQKVCVVFAFKGTCKLDESKEKATPPIYANEIKNESIRIIAKSLLLALVGIIISYIIL